MRRALKWVGFAVVGIIGLVVIGAVVVFLLSNARMNTSYSFMPAEISIETDSASIARGGHIAVVRGCVECHGEDLGGATIFEEPVVARMYGSNLTSGQGGVANTYESGADWVRAIRHGIGPDDKPLLFMPSHEYQVLTDQDVSDLIAFITSRPAVDREMPEVEVGPLGRVLFLAGQFPLLPAEIIEHERVQPPEQVAAAPTAEYGAYLATGCSGCHGQNFAGGKIPGTPPDFPPAANLTPDVETGLGSWTEADFIRAMREGVRPDGSRIAEQMPVQLTSRMTDLELEALWSFFQTLDPLQGPGPAARAGS